MLVPPQKFGTVEGGLYRCVEVLPLNLGFLSTLGLSSIVWLDREKPGWQVEGFAKANGITVHIPHTGELEDESHSSLSVFLWRALRAVEVAIDVRNAPVLVVDPSGMTVGILRKLMHWNFSSVFSELRRMTENASYEIESFLETGTVSLEVHEKETQTAPQRPQPVQAETGPSFQSPSSSPQIPKSLLQRVQRERGREGRPSGNHVTLPPVEFLIHISPPL